jgi:hypothetical protein
MTTNPLSRRANFRPIDRFRDDLRRRYPDRAATASRANDRPAARDVARGLAQEISKLPPEIGVLLIVMGVAGLLLPGPVGSPFLVAGGIALWPSAFRKAEHWLQRTAPGLYDKGIGQMERFLADLERRYPGSMR